MDVIRQLAKVPTDMQDKPRIPIHIFDCGQDSRSSRPIDLDEEKQAAKVEARAAKEKPNAFEAYEARKVQPIDEPVEAEAPVEEDLDTLVAKLRAPPSGEHLDAK